MYVEGQEGTTQLLLANPHSMQFCPFLNKRKISPSSLRDLKIYFYQRLYEQIRLHSGCAEDIVTVIVFNQIVRERLKSFDRKRKCLKRITLSTILLLFKPKVLIHFYYFKSPINNSLIPRPTEFASTLTAPNEHSQQPINLLYNKSTSRCQVVICKSCDVTQSIENSLVTGRHKNPVSRTKVPEINRLDSRFEKAHFSPPIPGR